MMNIATMTSWEGVVMNNRLHFFFLNVGHVLNHPLMLIFATVAVLALANE